MVNYWQVSLVQRHKKSGKICSMQQLPCNVKCSSQPLSLSPFFDEKTRRLHVSTYAVNFSLGKKDSSGNAKQQDDGSQKKDLENHSAEAAGVGVVLDDSELWSKFEKLTNEMIVTKNGR